MSFEQTRDSVRLGASIFETRNMIIGQFLASTLIRAERAIRKPQKSKPFPVFNPDSVTLQTDNQRHVTRSSCTGKRTGNVARSGRSPLAARAPRAPRSRPSSAHTASAAAAAAAAAAATGDGHHTGIDREATSTSALECTRDGGWAAGRPSGPGGSPTGRWRHGGTQRALLLATAAAAAERHTDSISWHAL